MSKTEPANMKAYVRELMLEVVEIRDGRPWGRDYDDILKRVHERFPVVVYPGPHQGKPTRLDLKRLREYCYLMQADDRSIRMPVRPRSPRAKRKSPPN